jgi:hypothetical protein
LSAVLTTALSAFRGTYPGVRAPWLLDLRVWASEAGDVLYEAECAAAADPGPASAACRTRSRHRLSALIGRGSFFVADDAPDEVGSEKAVRPRVLLRQAVGYLVAAERVLAGAGPHFPVPLSNPREALRVLRRAFMSEIRETLAPPTPDASSTCAGSQLRPQF